MSQTMASMVQAFNGGTENMGKLVTSDGDGGGLRMHSLRRPHQTFLLNFIFKCQKENYNYYFHD